MMESRQPSSDPTRRHGWTYVRHLRPVPGPTHKKPIHIPTREDTPGRPARTVTDAKFERDLYHR
jgi:hypothetical protein